MTRLVALALGSLVADAMATDLQQTTLTLDGLAGYEAHESHAKLSLTLDQAVDEHWHLLLGSAGERFDFTGVAAELPVTLQSAAAILGVEYRVKDNPVFALNLQPGWYGDENFSSGAFDMPVTLILAYPLNDRWAVVGGLEYSRLGDYILPIIGVSADIDPHWKMDLVFPETTLSYLPDKQNTASLFTELLGTGYQLSDRRPVSYYQWHAGASWERKFQDGWCASVKAGWAFDRVLDFYQNSSREHLGNAPFVELGLSWKW